MARHCAVYQVAHHILTWQGEKPATGLQAKARQARYDLMTVWCNNHGVHTLATAHTMDDQAETVVMRQRRTASVRSLAGIWPATVWNGVAVVRPLLAQRRAALRDMLRRAGWPWIEDPSNDNPHFERVRIRQDMVDGDVERLAGIATQAQAETCRIDEASAAIFRDMAIVEPTGLLRLPRAALSDQGAALPDVLAHAVAMAGGYRPEPEAVARLARQVLGTQPFRTTLGGALVAGRRREILLGREPARIDAKPMMVGDRPVLWDGRFTVVAPPGSAITPAGPRCPKLDKTLPAFVLASLPLLTLPDGTSHLPHFHRIVGTDVSLGERFHL